MQKLTMLLFLLSVSGQAQSAPKPGANVYIAPVNGNEIVLAAAFSKKAVPLSVVLDRDKADYLLESVVIEPPFSVKMSISLVDVHTSRVVFAYSVQKNRGNELQNAAEASAKALKDFMTKPQK